MKKTINEIKKNSDFMVITREDGQDMAIIALARPDLIKRIKQAIADMYCLEAGDKLTFCKSSFSSHNMRGILNIKIIQSESRREEFMTLSSTFLY